MEVGLESTIITVSNIWFLLSGIRHLLKRMRILMREELEERLEEGILSLLDEFGG
jgi:hypothetical protein